MLLGEMMLIVVSLKKELHDFMAFPLFTGCTNSKHGGTIANPFISYVFNSLTSFVILGQCIIVKEIDTMTSIDNRPTK